MIDNLGEIIRERRIRKDMSRAKVSRDSGVNVQTLKHIEDAGYAAGTVGTLAPILKTLGLALTIGAESRLKVVDNASHTFITTRLPVEFAERLNKLSQDKHFSMDALMLMAVSHFLATEGKI